MVSLPPLSQPDNDKEVTVNLVSPKELSNIKFIDESSDSFTDSCENDANTKSKINRLIDSATSS